MAAIKVVNEENVDSMYPQDHFKVGLRHCLILQDYEGIVSDNPYDQGFMTNRLRFVDRNEAAYIAYEAGQIQYRKPKLFSEDIW